MTECLDKIGSLETGFGQVETKIGQLETRIGGLETVIEERFKQSEKHMGKLEFGLSELDKFLRGNGKAGVNV